MASVRSIKAGAAYVELFVSDSRLVRGLQAASRKLKAFGTAITGIGQKLLLAGTAATAPLVASAKAFSDMGDQMAKMSRRTGISVETLSELGYAAQLSGSDVETLETGLRRMQKTVAGAAGGSKSATEALTQLGLSVADLNGLSPDQQFKLIADRIAAISSPSQRAAAALQLFGRSGAKLLPLMLEGSQGIAALQEQARSLGLTMSTQDAKAAEALNDAFDTLWKVLKNGVFVIGAALAPTIRAAVEWITRTIVTTVQWIRENKDLIVTIFKVAVGVVAAGAALMGLGYAITTIGTVMGALAGIIAGVGTAIGMMGAILAAILSPLGLVITAVTALGAYLIYTSGAGGKALSWLGDRFGELKEFATAAFGGIADALMAGDIALAAKILWLSLKIAWEKGIAVLQSAWLTFKGWFLKVAYGAFYGTQAAWEIFQHGLTVAWIETTAFLSSTWTRFTSLVQSTWEVTQNWLAKRWIDLMGMFDEKLDTDAAKSLLDKGSNQAIAQIEQEKRQRLTEREQQRAGERQGELRFHEQNLAEIGKAYNDEAAALDAEKASKIADAEAELARLRKEWADAISEAKRKREAKDAAGPAQLDRPAELPDYLSGLGPTIEAAQKRTIGVSGTFSAMEAMRLGAGGVTDRIAKASEETAKNTKKLLDEVEDMDGLAFE